MNGRLYIVKADNELHLTQDITPLGDGFFWYEVAGCRKFVGGEDIFCFDNSSKDSNSLDQLLTCVWRAKYNTRSHTWYYDRARGILPLEGCKRDALKHMEKFTFRVVYSLSGHLPRKLYIGDKGTVFMGSVPGEEVMAHIEWDPGLAPYNFGTLMLYDRGFGYYVTYRYDESKPNVGYGNIANTIYNYIAAFPNGVSSKDIEDGLKLRHPSAAGRISDLHKAGRIKCIDRVKYYKSGKANSVWVINFDW